MALKGTSKYIKRRTVKTLKENSNHTSKDVLLHQIFDEISEEYKEVNGDGYLDEIIPLPQEGLSKIRNMQAIRQWFFIALLSTAIIYVLFNTGTSTDESQTEVHKVVQDHVVTHKIDQLIKSELNPEQAPMKRLDKTRTPEKNIDTRRNEVPAPKVLAVKNPKTPREAAIHSLRLQLEN